MFFALWYNHVWHTSMTVKIALNETPSIKTKRNALCKLVNLRVSNIESRISPKPPTTDPAKARMLSTSSLLRIIGNNLERIWLMNKRD